MRRIAEFLKEAAKHVDPKDFYEFYERHQLGEKLKKNAAQEQRLQELFREAEGRGSYVKYEVEAPIPEYKKYNEEDAMKEWVKQRGFLEYEDYVQTEKPKRYDEKFEKVADSGLKDNQDYTKSNDDDGKLFKK